MSFYKVYRCNISLKEVLLDALDSLDMEYEIQVKARIPILEKITVRAKPEARIRHGYGTVQFEKTPNQKYFTAGTTTENRNMVMRIQRAYGEKMIQKALQEHSFDVTREVDGEDILVIGEITIDD